MVKELIKFKNTSGKLYQIVRFFTSDRSLFLLSNDNLIRKVTKALIEWKYPFYLKTFNNPNYFFY
jgi:hypothetical protein